MAPEFNSSSLIQTPSEFGLAFLAAKDQCNIITQHTSLDASVLEIEKESLKTFLSALVEGPDL